MTTEQRDLNQAATNLSIPDTVDSSESSRPQAPQVGQTVEGDRNQAIGQMSGGNAMGNVQGAVFNISGSTITNLTGSGDIHYQEALHQPPVLGADAKVTGEPQ